MALQGEAKKLYHREYMRRQRAGLPTRGVVKPKVMEQWCSECVLPPSPERIVVSLGSGHLAHDCGVTVFQHACQLGCEGIVSKRLGSRYRSGRSPDWLKFKNPQAPAVRREAEEDWGRQ